MDVKLRQSFIDDSLHLHSLWEKSVRATHDFLTSSDIELISKQVEDYFRNGKFLVATINDLPVAFMGMTENKIDSLFVHPDFLGKGIGKIFIDQAKSNFDIIAVDVNEANKGAYHFYLKLGFKVISRSETDDEGRPFPILNMLYEKREA